MLIAFTLFKRVSNSIYSRFGPRFNPNFYRIDVTFASPPGSYYIANFEKRTAEGLDLESLVRAHATPVSSIHDVAEPLASDILAKFPAARDIQLRFCPDIRHVYNIDNIHLAECTFLKTSTPVERPSDKHNHSYRFQTEWQLSISPQSGCTVFLSLVTQERCASTVRDQISSLKNSRSRPSLNCVHPTFGLHEQVASIAAAELQRGSADGVALHLARYLFYLADEQSSNKRLQHAGVIMRDIIPYSKGSQSRATRIAEDRSRENIQKVFTYCEVDLYRQHYELSLGRLRSKDFQIGRHRAFLALGSNLGNRVEMIESALRKMGDRGLSVSRTSALYETKPMYLENQESFINGACEVCSTDVTYR